MDDFDPFHIVYDFLSDDEDDLDIIDIVENPRRPRMFRPRIENMDIWVDTEFIARFRVSKASVELIVQAIGLHLQRNTEQ